MKAAGDDRPRSPAVEGGHDRAVLRLVLMGVSGSGKTSVGEALARKAEIVYVDGDALHPAANIEKMSAGIPLEDVDRWGWLDAVGTRLAEAKQPTAIGCSALKRSYRDRIRMRAGESVVFVHLLGSRSLIEGRMAARKGHFMPAFLLDSQFAALEPLEAAEQGFVIDIDRPVAAIAEAIFEDLERRGWPRAMPA